MKYQAILFDLDGTLLPMDTDKFMKLYFGALCQKAAPYGYAADRLIAALQEGIVAMVKNDGKASNRDVFWQVFAKHLGEQVLELEPEFDRFYHNEFHIARQATEENPDAKTLVQLARKYADKVVLATNPMFPPSGIEARLSWLGLTPDDFDLVTTYDNSSYCKPNPAYFEQIFEKLGLDATQCLMVGNDLKEDGAVLKTGATLQILGDCLIEHGCDPSDFSVCTTKELIARWQ